MLKKPLGQLKQVDLRDVWLSESCDFTPYRQIQLKFWTEFRQHMESKGSFIKCQKPLPQSWTNYTLGRSGVHLASVVSIWNSLTGKKGPEIRAELYLDGPKAKQEFAILEKQKQTIEAKLGLNLTWHNQDNTDSCRLYTRQDADFTNEALWPEQFEWLRTRLEKMHQVFTPLVKDLKQSSLE